MPPLPLRGQGAAAVVSAGVAGGVGGSATGGAEARIELRVMPISSSSNTITRRITDEASSGNQQYHIYSRRGRSFLSCEGKKLHHITCVRPPPQHAYYI